MIILVLLQMAYHLIGDLLHEWMGIMLFGLLILHNILDWKWYSNLFKGKYTPVRIFHTTINLLLLVSFLCTAVSTVFLSPTISVIFHLKAVLLGRRMHMVFTTWSFVLTSAHIGLHWNRGIGGLKKHSKRTQCLYRFSIMLVSGYGLYAFISRELLQRMLFLSEYAFFNYEETMIHFIIDHIAILCLLSCFTYGVRQFIAKH